MHHLLNLPRELRDQIISLVVLSPPIAARGEMSRMWPHHIGFPKAPLYETYSAYGLLHTSKQLKDETEALLRHVQPPMQMNIALVASGKVTGEFRQPTWVCLPTRSASVEEMDLNIELRTDEPTQESNDRLIADLFTELVQNVKAILAHMHATCTTPAPERITRRNRDHYSIKCVNIRITASCDMTLDDAVIMASLDQIKKDVLIRKCMPTLQYSIMCQYEYAPSMDSFLNLPRKKLVLDATRFSLYNLFDFTRVRRITFWVNDQIWTTCYVAGKRYGKHRRRRLTGVPPGLPPPDKDEGCCVI
jgi:hypothetical protein